MLTLELSLAERDLLRKILESYVSELRHECRRGADLGAQGSFARPTRGPAAPQQVTRSVCANPFV